MDTRRLLSTTLLYGVADVSVLAVGGLLLLPLYTRTLSQADFGIYVIVRANIEIISYLLYFALPSAVARLYFEYKRKDEHVEYLSSVLMFFLVNLGVFLVVAPLWGTHLWSLLSPAAPASPYLGFSLAIATVGFFAGLGSLWLRLESRAAAFAALQISASIVLAAAAFFNLVWLDAGLPGLLSALLVSSACSALALPVLFKGRFRPVIRKEHIVVSLRFAGPIVVGYAAYFILNRVSTLVLQRHVAVEQIAIFGLAQQVATILTVATAAFGKAIQPAIFSAEPDQAIRLMESSGKILIWIMFSVTCMAVLFASDVFSLLAPSSYASGYEILLILLTGSFCYSFTLISDTALLYYKRPTISVAVSIVGAALSASLSLWWIPSYQLYGAAMAIAASFLTMALLSHGAAHRLTGHSYLAPMLLAVCAVGTLAALCAWLRGSGLSNAVEWSLKLCIAAVLLCVSYMFNVRTLRAKP